MSETYEALLRVQEKRERPILPGNGGSPTQTMPEEMLRQAEAILRFSEDVRRRMSDIGVDGIGGVLKLYGQLRSAMDKVTQSEIETSTAELTHLVETIQNLRDELMRMKALKLSLEGMR